MFDNRRSHETILNALLKVSVGLIVYLLAAASAVAQEFQPGNPMGEQDYFKQNMTECTNESVETLIRRLQNWQSPLGETIAVINQLVACGADAVPALVKILQNERDEVLTRRLAARTLGKIGTEGAIAALLKVAQQPQSKIHDSVIRALEDSPRGVIFLIAMNEAGQVEIRSQNAISSLIEALRHPDAVIRAAAAESLGEMGSISNVAIPALVRLVKDQDRSVRAEAISALVEIGSEGVEALLKSMQNREISFVSGTIAVLQVSDSPIVRVAVAKATPALLESFHNHSLAAADGCVLFELLSGTGQMEAGTEVLAVIQARDGNCSGGLQAGGAELILEAGMFRGMASQPAICRVRGMQRVLWRCRR